MAPQTFHTSRLRIEALRLDHAACVFPAQLDQTIYQFIPDEPLSLQELTRRYTFLENAKSPDGSEHWLNWIAFLKDSHAVVGTFQATIPAEGHASMAYTIFPPFWRQGYATEIGYRLISHIFNAYIPSTISAEIDIRNKASIQLVERWGFSRTKTTHDVDFFKGSSSDEYTYSMTLSEWTTSNQLCTD